MSGGWLIYTIMLVFAYIAFAVDGTPPKKIVSHCVAHRFNSKEVM